VLPSIAALIAVAATAAACGSEGIKVDDRGARLFAERCGGCHTLEAAGTQGSVGERVTGPNLNYRKETKESALFAIRNGGFSGAIMPQNVVVGKDAQAVAEFVARYAGSKSTGPPSPTPQGALGKRGGRGGQK
jgi:mono/diheme cytochrome c family protein